LPEPAEYFKKPLMGLSSDGNATVFFALREEKEWYKFEMKYFSFRSKSRLQQRAKYDKISL